MFACRSIDLYRQLMKRAGPGRVLAGQFLKASTSIGANEEEAQAATSHADFIAKQAIVLRESRESRYWLRLFEHCEIGDRTLVQPLGREAGELVAILTTIVKRARANAARSQGH